MNMRNFLRGSVPVLVIGGNPGGIAIAKGLIDAGVPVTLLGEGRPLGGRGALLTNGPRQVPVWPPAYQGTEPTEWTELALMLSRAHSKGICLQPEERLREVKVDEGRIVEVTTEGILGKVKRRPRAVVLASRLDHFLEKMEPGDQGLSPKQLNSLTYETDVVVHMRWRGGLAPNPDPTFPENSPWGFMNCSPMKGKKSAYSWAAFASNISPGDNPTSNAQSVLLEALFGKTDVEEIGLPEWDAETRFVQDVGPGKISKTVLNTIDTTLGAIVNLARVGDLATGRRTTVREEIDQATKLVQSWVND
jgi:hypothetical protein